MFQVQSSSFRAGAAAQKEGGPLACCTGWKGVVLACDDAVVDTSLAVWSWRSAGTAGLAALGTGARWPASLGWRERGEDSLWWEGACGEVSLLPLVPCSSWQFPEAGLFASGVTP